MAYSDSSVRNAPRLAWIIVLLIASSSAAALDVACSGLLDQYLRVDPASMTLHLLVAYLFAQ